MLLKDSPLYWEGSLDLKRGNRQERPQPGWTYGLRSHMSKRGLSTVRNRPTSHQASIRRWFCPP